MCKTNPNIYEPAKNFFQARKKYTPKKQIEFYSIRDRFIAVQEIKRHGMQQSRTP
jgi:hypothetical protein